MGAALLTSVIALAGGAYAKDAPPIVQASNVIVQSLERYQRGDFDDAVEALLRDRTVRSLSGEFRRWAGGWIDAGPGADRLKRTHTVAAMSVELMAAAFTQSSSDYIASRDLVNWACGRVRRLPVSAFERWFHLALIALAQGASDDSFISGVRTHIAIYPPVGGSHAQHAAVRFPGEGRFRLAYVTARWETQQIATWPMTPATLIHRGFGRFSFEWSSNDIPALDATERMLATLFADHGVGAEARLRSGVLKFLRSREADAKVDLIEAARAEDGAIRYLAFLMLGTLEDQAGHLQEAVTYFRRAHDIVAAPAAAVTLGSGLYRLGAMEAAARVLQGLESGSLIADPWHLYSQRDYRFQEAFRRQMRDTLRRQ